jgi:hypothetical protein
MSDETGSSQTAGRPAGRGRRSPRRGGRGYRGRGGRRPAAAGPNVAPTTGEVAPGEELTEQQQPGAEGVPTTMEPEAVGEGSTQQDVREEIAGAELEPPPPREERSSEPYRPARPQRPPQPPPQRFQPRQQRQPHPAQQAARQHGSAIHQAIEDVERIVTDLREALEEMEEVLETLELAEREKTADEREIDQLRRALRGLHRGPERGPGGPRPQQYGQHQQRSFRGGPERRGPQGHRVENEAAQAESAHRDEPASSMSAPPPEAPEDFEPPQPS